MRRTLHSGRLSRSSPVRRPASPKDNEENVCVGPAPGTAGTDRNPAPPRDHAPPPGSGSRPDPDPRDRVRRLPYRPACDRRGFEGGEPAAGSRPSGGGRCGCARSRREPVPAGRPRRHRLAARHMRRVRPLRGGAREPVWRVGLHGIPPARRLRRGGGGARGLRVCRPGGLRGRGGGAAVVRRHHRLSRAQAGRPAARGAVVAGRIRVVGPRRAPDRSPPWPRGPCRHAWPRPPGAGATDGRRVGWRTRRPAARARALRDRVRPRRRDGARRARGGGARGHRGPRRDPHERDPARSTTRSTSSTRSGCRASRPIRGGTGGSCWRWLPRFRSGPRLRGFR